MARKSNLQVNFWHELKRRRVIHVVTVYAAIAFVILQLADLISRPLQLPEWTEAFVIVLLCIGFVISVFISWIYDITPTGVRKTKPVSSLKQNGTSDTRSPAGWKAATFISGIIIIVLLGYNFLSGRRSDPEITRSEKSIAVLPFINDSPSDSNQYFINGLMDEILNNLQKIKEFRVLSRTSTNKFKGSDIPTIPEIAKKLGVTYIVEGSGQKYGNSYRLRVQLITGENERHLWAQSYEKEIHETKDIFGIQSEIAQSIASELKATITPEEKQLIEKVSTTNLTAYDFYQKGREEFINFMIDNDNRSALDKAGIFFRKALENDPEYAEAYVGQAEVYWNKHYWRDYLSENFMDSVMVLANIALSHNDKLSEAYFIRGAYYDEKGMKEKAVREYDKAIKLNPNDWMAYYGIGLMYDPIDPVKSLESYLKATSLDHDNSLPTIFRRIGGKFLVTGYIDQARSYFYKAFELDLDSAFYLNCLAGIEMDQGNYEKSLEFCRRAYLNRPNYTDAISRLGEIYQFNRQYNESLKYYKELSTLTGASDHRTAFTYWQTGLRSEADSLFKDHLEFCNNVVKSDRPYYYVFWVNYDLASIYAFRGDRENAFKNLRLFSQNNNCELWMLTHLKYDPLFDNIRNEPEFGQIYRDMETRYQAVHERVGKWLEEQRIL